MTVDNNLEASLSVDCPQNQCSCRFLSSKQDILAITSVCAVPSILFWEHLSIAKISE